MTERSFLLRLAWESAQTMHGGHFAMPKWLTKSTVEQVTHGGRGMHQNIAGGSCRMILLAAIVTKTPKP